MPGVANRTKPNQQPIEPNRLIGVRLVRQSNIIELEIFVSSIKFDYRTQSNSIDAIGSILFGRKTKWYTKLISINFLVELEGIHSLTEF